MANTDFIAAIDLGTSHMAGMVGTRTPSGVLSILASDVEKTDRSMRRGCVYNGEEVAYHVNALVRKLENKLGDSKIDKIYIGVGGFSLRSVDHTVTRTFGAEREITEDLLLNMEKECRNYHPAGLEVFDIVSPVYCLDGRVERDPVGTTCSRIDARYKLIVGRPVMYSSLKKMTDRINCKVPQILVSPIALANFVLTDAERQQGCILIDFGAGVTSVSAYRRNQLQMLYVVPFGSHLITRDIESGLDVPESEAERLKRVHGTALPNKEEQQLPIDINRMNGMATIKQADLDEIVEARVREILENVYARVLDANILKEGSYTVVIAGSGAMLKDLREAVKMRFKMDVRIASVRRDLVMGNDMIANNPEYMLAASLLLLCRENCAKQPEKVVPPARPKSPSVEINIGVGKEPERPIETEQNPGGSKGESMKETNPENKPQGGGSDEGGKRRKRWWIGDLFTNTIREVNKELKINDNDY